MDATPGNTNQGNSRLRIAMAFVVLFLCALPTANVNAQVLRIRSRDSDQSIVHTLSDGPQSFAPVRWDINNAALRDGCTVQWTAAAFNHETVKNQRADCQITLQLAKSTRESRWKVTSAADATDVATGRDTATVSLTANGRGHASVELQIRFVGSNVSELAAGRYRTTLTGTITGL